MYVPFSIVYFIAFCICKFAKSLNVNSPNHLTKICQITYRDKSGLECDAVIRLKNGAFGLVEVKLGGDHLIEEGAANLRKLGAKIDTTKMKESSFLMVLTAVGKYAYRRNDGVYVVPVGTLRD